jgi:glycosyltransferase involved in cell wall biosynthesis
MVEAMSLLPDVRVVFAGGHLGSHGSRTYLELMRLAQTNRVADRLSVTGYLPETEYLSLLMSADLAVCPFGPHKSGSASLCTLIAVGCPILASEIPLVAEYNAISPGAISTFSPFTAEALAHAVTELLAVPKETLTRGLAEIRERLSIEHTCDRHVESYRRVLAMVPSDDVAL